MNKASSQFSEQEETIDKNMKQGYRTDSEKVQLNTAVSKKYDGIINKKTYLVKYHLNTICYLAITQM